MAQARKRRRKHRGTQAGTIEARGRTSRPQPGTTRSSSGAKRSSTRPNRYDKPPTWRGSATRALIPAVLFAVVVAVTSKSPAAAPLAGVIVLGVYIPMTYWFDTFLYRRHQRRKQAGGG